MARKWQGHVGGRSCLFARWRGPGLDDDGVGFALERAAIEITEEFPARKTCGAEKQFHLGFVNPSHDRFGRMSLYRLAFGIEHFDLDERILELFDVIEGSGVPHANGQTGFGMLDFNFEFAFAGRLRDERWARKIGIEDEQSAGLKVIATCLKTTKLVVGGQVMREGVERNHDQRVSARQTEAGHVRLVQRRLESGFRGFLAQARKHRRKEIKPLNVQSCFQAREHDPAGAAGDIENGTASGFGEFEVEVEAEIEILEEDVVECAIVKRRRFDWRR